MKKFLALILVAILMVSVFAACTTGTGKTTTGTTATTAKVQDTLKIGVDDLYPPMEFKDESNKTVGFDVDMATEIGKRINMKVEFVSTAWDGIFNALKTDKFDCIISSISMTKDRVENFEFTRPYIANSQMIVVKNGDNSITKPEDLAGKKVGCQIETTANESADKLQAKGIKFGSLKTYDSIIQPFSDMKAGRLNAIIVDEVVGQYYIGKDTANFKAASVKLTNEPIGVCIKKGNTALRDKIQKAIDEMIADGTMKTISIKWFGTDLTSNIDTVLKDLS